MKQKQWRHCRCHFQNCTERRLLLTSSFNYCKTREEDGREACRKYFAFCKQASRVLLLQVCLLTTLLFSSGNSIAVRSCQRLLRYNYGWLNIYRIRTVMPGSRRHSVCPRQPLGLFFATFNAIFNAAVFLLLLSPLVTFNAHTP